MNTTEEERLAIIEYIVGSLLILVTCAVVYSITLVAKFMIRKP